MENPKGKSQERKPCPFCGKGGKHLTVFNDYEVSEVVCDSCGANGPIGMKRKDAWEKWNNRVEG